MRIVSFAFVFGVLCCCTRVTYSQNCDLNCADGCSVQLAGKCDSTCAPNYYLTGTKTCASCDTACIWNQVETTACNGISNRVCSDCDPNCPGGCRTQLAGKCDSNCAPYYYLTATKTCTSCDAPCSANQVETTPCDGVTNRVCSDCDPNCADGCSVQLAGKCDSTCAHIYYLTGTNICAPCDAACMSNQVETTPCNGVSNRVCSDCDPNCADGCSVQLAGKCDSMCASNYYLTATNTCASPTIPPVPSDTIDVIGRLYGPLAGGTRFTLVGDSQTLAYTNGSNATISMVYIGVYTATVVYIAIGKLQVTTPPANRTGFEAIILGTVGGQLVDTRRTFEYRNNTRVNDMQPRQYLFEGGTVTNVTGTNIDSVADPGISTTVIVTRWTDTNKTGNSNTITNIERCVVVDSTRMQCLIPIVPIPSDFSKNDTTDSNVPGVAAFIGPNGKDRADVYIGLILDGDVAYTNISDRLPNVKVSFFERPPLDCSQTNAKFNPESDTSIAIKGSSLTRANRLIDIKVTIGVGVCNVTQLTDNEIVCKPPVEAPNKGNNTLCPNDGSLPVEVFIGFAEYHCNCLRYDFNPINNVPLIVGLVVGLGGGLFVIAIVIAVISVCRRRGNKKRQPTTVHENSRTFPTEASDLYNPNASNSTALRDFESDTYGGAYSMSVPNIELDTFSGDYSTSLPNS